MGRTHGDKVTAGPVEGEGVLSFYNSLCPATVTSADHQCSGAAEKPVMQAPRSQSGPWGTGVTVPRSLS